MGLMVCVDSKCESTYFKNNKNTYDYQVMYKQCPYLNIKAGQVYDGMQLDTFSQSIEIKW